MRNFRLWAALQLLLFWAVEVASGATIYVKATGTGSANGTSAANAVGQAGAMALASVGDTLIMCGPGFSSFLITKNDLKVFSATSAGVTNKWSWEVTGSPGEHGVYTGTGVTGVRIWGVKVLSSYISGIKFNGNDSRLKDAWVQRAGRGDPAWVTNSNGSYTGQGIEAHNLADIWIETSLFENNGARLNQDHGGYISGTNIFIIGNIFRTNCAYGLQVYDGTGDNHNVWVVGNLIHDNGSPGVSASTLTLWTYGVKTNFVINNTLIGRTGKYGGNYNGANSSSRLGFSNNIVVGDAGYGIFPQTGAGGTNCVWSAYNLKSSMLAGEPQGIGDVAGTATFNSEANARYCPAPTSPARNMALASAAYSVDFFGRPQIAVKDVGALQYEDRLNSDARNWGDGARDPWVREPRQARVKAIAGGHQLTFVPVNNQAASYAISRKDSVNNTWAALATVGRTETVYLDPTSAMTNGVTYSYSISPDTSLGNGGGISTDVLPIICDRVSAIHPTRLLSWSDANTGVPGGIPTGRTQFCNVLISIPGTNIVAVGDGIEDDQPAIQAAINRCPTNAFVYLPEARYACYTNLVINGNYRTLRGAGPGTVLVQNYLSEIYSTNTNTMVITTNIVGNFINFGSYSEQGTQRTNIVDIPIGATNTTWDSVNGLGALFPGTNGTVKFWMGDGGVSSGFAALTDGDGSSDPVHYSANGSTKSQAGAPLVRFLARITGTNTGNQVFFSPPSPYFFPSNSTRSQYLYVNELKFSGIEDLSVECGGRISVGIQFSQGMGSWLKGVWITRPVKAHVAVSYSTLGEITECVFDGAPAYGPSQGIGLHLDSHAYGFKIYDNVMRSNFPAIELYLGASGHAITYNYFLNSQGGLAPIDNHNAHNFLNLIEGNVGYGILQDGYFGSAEEWTVFRNWFHGDETAFGARKILNLGHWTRDWNILANVIGNPRTNWGDYLQQSGWNNSNTVRRRYGYPNMGNDTFTGTNQTIQATNYGFMDFYVWSNTVDHANVEYGSIGTWTTNYNAAISNRTFSYSYFTNWNDATPPSWWTNASRTNAPWPPIGPDVAGHTNLIPAMMRFHDLGAIVVAGTPPPGVSSIYDDEFNRILKWFFFPIITHPLSR